MRTPASVTLVAVLVLPFFVGCTSQPAPLPTNDDPIAVAERLVQQQRKIEEHKAAAIAAEQRRAKAAFFQVNEADLAQAERLVPATQREQVASLMMVGVKNFDDARFALDQGAGGIFIGSWTDPALLTQPGRDLTALREVVQRPFSVSIDAEGGRVQRQPALFGSVPSPRSLAGSTSPEETQRIAYDLGTRLRSAGVTVDFAPVLDVDARKDHSAIGDRSFSPDPHVAATYGAAFAHGLSDAGVRPVYKHFPGHGRASGDSHFQSVTAPPLADVQAVDLAPYGPALRQAPGGVMMGHVQVPGLGDGAPSSINPAAYAMLRAGDYPGGSPFQGVIYTDDLSGMKAISSRMRTPEAATAALRAGADCALWISTADLVAAIDAADRAVTSGDYSQRQMLDSVMRLKLQLALYESFN
ncbi:glycoside hydrolase family 3 N-terminal domain-containing protein [Staphylococcus chromogenes]|nr:glycoside hydrolase family 3 N-terminal domain-containing protein [Staphylococcus chromogenes]